MMFSGAVRHIGPRYPHIDHVQINRFLESINGDIHCRYDVNGSSNVGVINRTSADLGNADPVAAGHDR